MSGNTSEQPAKGRKVLWGVVIGVITIVGVMVVGYLFSPGDEEPELFSSPTEQRLWGQNEWTAFMDSVPDSDPFDPQYHSTIHNVRVEPVPKSENRTQVVIRADDAAGKFTPELEMVKVKGGELAKIGEGGSFQVKVISAGTIAKDRWLPDREHYMKLDYFDPEFNRLTPEEALARAPKMEIDSSYVNEPEPATILHIEGAITGVENVKWNVRGVFDANTRLKLNSGASWYNAADRLSAEVHVQAVHNTPLIVGIDMAHGPVIDVDVEPRAGESAKGPNFRMEVAAVVPGKKTSWGTSGSVDEKKFRLGIKPGTEDKAVTFVLLVEPAIFDDMIQYQLIDSEGKEHPLWGGGGSGNFKYVSADVNPAEMRTLRAAYRTKLTRLAVELPGLPAVPDENRSPTNLFDVRIPQALVENEYELRQAIARTIQFKQRTGTGAKFSRTDPPFPLDVEDTTPRALLQQYQGLRPDLEVEVDSANHEITFKARSTAPGPRRRGFFEWLRRIF